MSQDNVEIVRQVFAAYARGGINAVALFLHEDFEMHQLPAIR